MMCPEDLRRYEDRFNKCVLSDLDVGVAVLHGFVTERYTLYVRQDIVWLRVMSVAERSTPEMLGLLAVLRKMGVEFDPEKTAHV